MRPSQRKGHVFVHVRGKQSGNVIRGTAVPGAEIDVVNLSASAGDPTGFHDTVTIARADARGRFVGSFPMREGDVMRIRARAPRGRSPWILFRARGLGNRPRRVSVALTRIGVRDLGNGQVHVFALSRSRPIAPPGARLVLVNTRTQSRARMVVNQRGVITGRITLRGRAGDALRAFVENDHARKVSVRLVGTLVTPPAKAQMTDHVFPYGHHQRLGFVPLVRELRAPLFGASPRPVDVFQSELPNCHIASASAALAHARPQLLKRAIKRVGEGRYRVRFHVLRGGAGQRTARDIEVSAELYVRPSGELLYGSTAPDRPPVLWWPLLEKAFARWKGSYRSIGEGGCADVVLQSLTGRPARRFFVDSKRDGEVDRVWGELRAAFASRLPVVAGTGSSVSRCRNTGFVPDHAYTVLGCRQRRGARLVVVRNPWGEDAKPPCRERKNGFLEIEIEEFVRLFNVVSTVR